MSARVIIDVSSTMDIPLTGVGWRTIYLINAFLEQNRELEVCLFAARSRKTRASDFPFQKTHSYRVIVPFFRRLKALLWPTVEWPPIEWFCGKADIAHGTFHDLPASRKAIRVVTIHDLSFLLHPDTHTPETIKTQTRLVRHAVARADAIEVVSESCKQDLIEVLGVSSNKIHVVPNGIELDLWEKPLDATALAQAKHSFGITRSYFIHLGTIEPRKNLPRLLEAYARVRQRYHVYPQLVLVGAKGWKAETTYEALARHDFGTDVVVCGWVPRETAALLLRGAAACVYPSLYEGFGLPVLEAMAAKVPVITSTAAALKEVSGGHCILVDPLSVESIEAGLDLFLSRPDVAKSRAQAAYQRAQKMTWKYSAERLSHLYKTLLRENEV